MPRQRVIAAILAGGSGTRLGADRPKQFVKLAGKSVLEHAYSAFDGHELVDEIVLVTPASLDSVDRDQITTIQETSRKPLRIVVGGATRNESTLCALNAISDDDGIILTHDAARPLISADVISRCINALSSADAVDVVVECADTVVEVDFDSCIRAIPDRATLRLGQTPQGFRLGLLRQAYRLAQRSGKLHFTDDCAVLMQSFPNARIRCVPGEAKNVKITRAIDFVIADRLFQLSSMTSGSDEYGPASLAKLAARTIVVIGASSGIGLALANEGKSVGANVIGLSPSLSDFDLTKPEVIERTLSRIRQECGPIHHIVNTSGLLIRKDLANTDVKEIESSISTNFTGAAYLAHYSFKFLEETTGHLVFFTSSSFTRGRASYATYSASKAAIVNMTQALADEWARAGIKVNCVCPERTDTRMRRDAFPNEDRSTLLSPTKVASETLGLLCSELTGQVLDVKQI